MQTRDISMEDTSIESPKQVICRLAKEAAHAITRSQQKIKINALRQFLLTGHSVDIDYYHKPPTDMLMEQNEESAALLLVNHFGADPGKIAYHYARKQRMDDLQKLLFTFSANRVWFWAMHGYVDGMDPANLGHTKILFQLIDNSNDEIACASYAAEAAATRHNEALVIDLALRYKIDEEDGLNIYVARGDVSRVNMILERYPAFSTAAAELYLWAGLRENARQLIANNRNIDIHQVTATAAKIEDDELVEELLESGGSINAAVYGYARNGNVDKVNKLLDREASLEIAFCGFLSSCHYWLLDKYFPDNFTHVMSYHLFQLEENIPDAVRLLAFMQNDDHRKAIVQRFIFVQFKNRFYNDTTGVHNLMHEFYLDYEHARLIQLDLPPRDRKSFLYYLREHHMTFEQIYAMKFMPAIKTWYNQARELTKHKHLNNNVTALVARYAFGLPYDDGETLRAMTTPAKYKPTLFAPPAQPAQKRKQADHGNTKRPRR